MNISFASAGSVITSSSWTPVFSGLSVTYNGGSVSYTGDWTAVGKIVYWFARIMPSGGATVASILGTTRINNLPFNIASPGALCSAVNASTLEDYGNSAGHPTAGWINTPPWIATANEIVISGMFIRS